MSDSGRPYKKGLDYFELDCHMDSKIKLIQAEFGLKGFAVFVLLLQKIYGEEGYYCEWNRDVSLLFATESGKVSAGDENNLIDEIVAACIRRGIFSQELFERYGILTSRGIQERYFNATSRREKVEVENQYLLISAPKNAIYVDRNSIYVDRNPINVNRNSQRKEEKRKEEKRTQTCARADEKFEQFWKLYPRKTGRGIVERYWATEINPDEELFKQIMEALQHNIDRNPLWKADNGRYIPNPIKWLEEKRWLDEIREGDQYDTKQSSKPNKFLDFNQREYTKADYDALERKKLMEGRDKK